MKRALLVCLALIGAATIPASADAAPTKAPVLAKKSRGYAHVSVCRATLRGYRSDNDVRRFLRQWPSRFKATFVGWTRFVQRYTRPSAVTISFRFRLRGAGGGVFIRNATCGADYSPWDDVWGE